MTPTSQWIWSLDGWIVYPVDDYVARYGIDHPEISLPLIERLTGRDLHPLRISGAASLGIDELLIEMFGAVDTARRDDEKKEG